MKKYRVKDFEIRGYWTRSQLLGRENEYAYRIYWNGKDLDKVYGTKRDAQRFVSSFVKKANTLIDEYNKRA